MSTEIFDARGNPILPRVITHWGDGATALTNRDVSGDLQVLTDLKKGAQDADAVAAETTNVLKVLAFLQAINSVGTVDRLIVRDALSTLQEDVKGLVTVSQLWVGNDATNNYHLPVQGAQYVSDGVSHSAAKHAMYALALPYAWNGTTADRQRNNVEATLLASAVRAGTTNSSDQTNYNARGVMVFFNVTAVPGGDTVQCRLQVKDPVSGTYMDVMAPAATAVTGLFVYVFYPGAGTNTVTETSQAPLPRTWRASIVHSAGTNFTYSVAACLIN